MSSSGSVERSDLVERFRIPLVWRLLSLPGEPSDKCQSPFREDKHPSFTIFDEGKAFKDFSTGEGGNVFRFYGIASGCGPLNEYRAFKDFLRSKGYAITANSSANPSSVTAERFSGLGKGKSDPGDQSVLKAALATFRSPTDNDCRAIADKRGINAIGCYLAGRLGCLVIGEVGGFKSWILTDAAQRCAEARRMDGEPYPAIGTLKERKAHTLKGSKKNWPLGLQPYLGFHERVQKILWVEGGPDYLAACHWIGIYKPFDVLPVTMLGAVAGQAGLDEEALELLRGRRIRVIPHADQAGEKTQINWVAMLRALGCEVDGLHVEELHGQAKDLNDLTRLLTEEQQEADAVNLLP
jgi:hypothetical protein